MRENRDNLQFREIEFINNYNQKVPGSCLIKQGNTQVLTTATFADKIPFFLKDATKNHGWITAEYSLLPGSTGNDRIQRERGKIHKRNIEIQRFIGRALRNTVDLSQLGKRTIYIDCDVLKADGSTRCISFNSAMLSLMQLLKYLVFEHLIKELPPVIYSSAISIGVKNKQLLVDLDYAEDSGIDSDISVISTEAGEIIEFQTHVERKPLDPNILTKAMELAIEKNLEIIDLMKTSL